MNYLAQVNIGQQYGSPYGQTRTIGDLVSQLLATAPVFAGILLLLFIIVAGLSIISSAGQDNPQGAANAKKAASMALVGFIVIFVAYWVIQIIEYILGQPFVTQPGF